MEDWSSVLTALGQALSWVGRNGTLFVVALGGATIAHLFYTFPEASRLRRRLQAMFPKKRGATLARLHFVVLIAAGTFVATVLLQPSTNKEAFLAGFTWLSVVSELNRGAGKRKPEGSPS